MISAPAAPFKRFRARPIAGPCSAVHNGTMPQNITCPACGAALRVREELAGKRVKCPKCAGAVSVPKPVDAPVAADPLPPLAEEVTVSPIAEGQAVSVRPTARPSRRCPACGEPNPQSARRCRHCREWLENDEPEERPKRRKSTFQPCPRCGARGAKRVNWTIWGSFYGPALFNHVRCPECGHAYNGRTGGSNLLPAIILVTIPTILIAAIVVFVILILKSRGVL